MTYKYTENRKETRYVMIDGILSRMTLAVGGRVVEKQREINNSVFSCKLSKTHYNEVTLTNNTNRNMKTPAEKANDLIDLLIKEMGLKNDAALCRKIGELYPVVSKLRHGKIPVGATFIVRAHVASGIPVRKLIDVAGLNFSPVKNEAA